MIDEKKLIEKSKVYKSRWDFHEGIAYGLQIAIEATEKQPKVGEWIPCSERLPECEFGFETGPFMFQLKHTETIEAGYYGEGGHWRDRYFRTYRDDLDGFDVSDVVAWMPLPEPYKPTSALPESWKESVMQSFMKGE